MSKPVYITTDSTSDFSVEFLERFNVKVAPLHVVLGDKVYLDGVEFTREMIYDYYEKEKIVPRTSAVSPQEFIDFFTPLVEAGYDVVHLDISSKLSGTYQNAMIASQDMPGVYPIDTQQLTSGMGEMVIAACRMRDEGKDAATIAQAMIDLIPKVNTSFVLDTLEYMWKGGRCTGVTAFGANLLHLKPCIEMRDGKLEVCKKYRGNIFKVYEKYITERLAGKKVDPNFIFITTSLTLPDDVRERLDALVRSIVPDAKEIVFGYVGCTVTCHCGPGTLGLLFLEQ